MLTEEIQAEVQSEAARLLHGEIGELKNLASDIEIEARLNEIKKNQ